MRSDLLGLLLAAAVVCGLPMGPQEVRTLGESARTGQAPQPQPAPPADAPPADAPPAGPAGGGITPNQMIATAVHQVHAEDAAALAARQATKRVSDTVKHVWATSDLNKEFDKDLTDPKKHWTCRYCHYQCKTIQCRNYCHEEHCGAVVKFGKQGVGRMGFGNGQVTPGFVNSVNQANADLERTETATTDSQFREASRSVNEVMDQGAQDYQNFNNNMQYADAMNQMAYPSEADYQAQDDQIGDIEAQNTQQEIDTANDDIEESNQETAQNSAYENTVNSNTEADGLMGEGDPLTSEVQDVEDAEDSTLDTTEMDQTTGTTAEMTGVENVEAEVEKMKVKATAAASMADKSATKTEEYDADAKETIEDAERELGDASPKSPK